jgi:hypothetical protein
LDRDVYVRGFNAKDKLCAPNCRMQARGVFTSKGATSVSKGAIGAFSDPALMCGPALQPTRNEPAPEPQKPPAPADQPAKKPNPEADGAPHKLFENRIEKEIVEKRKLAAPLKAPGPGESLAKEEAVEADAAGRAQVKRAIEKALVEKENRQEVRKGKVPNDPALIDKLLKAEEVEKLRKTEGVEKHRKAGEADGLRQAEAVEKLRKAEEVEKLRKSDEVDKKALVPEDAKPKLKPAPTSFEPADAGRSPDEITAKLEEARATSLPPPLPIASARAPAAPSYRAVLPAPQAPPAPYPGWQPFAATFDADAPLQLTGTVSKIDLRGAVVVFWVEAASVSPGSTTGAKTGTVWRVDGPRMDIATPALKSLAPGQNVTVRGYNAKDASCKPECVMAGRDVTVSKAN